jgi:hypothetical protein
MNVTRPIWPGKPTPRQARAPGYMCCRRSQRYPSLRRLCNPLARITDGTHSAMQRWVIVSVILAIQVSAGAALSADLLILHPQRRQSAVPHRFPTFIGRAPALPDCPLAMSRHLFALSGCVAYEAKDLRSRAYDWLMVCVGLVRDSGSGFVRLNELNTIASAMRPGELSWRHAIPRNAPFPLVTKRPGAMARTAIPPPYTLSPCSARSCGSA